MPSIIHRYFLNFDIHFYTDHYIEIQKILKPYHIYYNDPYFVIEDDISSQQLTNGFNIVFNPSHSLSQNYTISTNLTWIIKLYNLFKRAHADVNQAFSVFDSNMNKLFPNGPGAIYLPDNHEIDKIAKQYYDTLPKTMYPSGHGLISWLPHIDFKERKHAKALADDLMNGTVTNFDAYLKELAVNYNIHLVNIINTHVKDFNIIVYMIGDRYPTDIQQDLVIQLLRYQYHHLIEDANNASNFKVKNVPASYSEIISSRIYQQLHDNSNVRYLGTAQRGD